MQLNSIVYTKFFILNVSVFFSIERMVIMEAIKAIFSKLFELLPRAIINLFI